MFIATALFVLHVSGLAQTKEKHQAKPAKVATTKTFHNPANGTTRLPVSGTAPVTKIKQDGTADMRYKENKEASKITASTSIHPKKDGTPDMRYKENKKKG